MQLEAGSPQLHPISEVAADTTIEPQGQEDTRGRQVVWVTSGPKFSSLIRTVHTTNWAD